MNSPKLMVGTLKKQIYTKYRNKYNKNKKYRANRKISET